MNDTVYYISEASKKVDVEPHVLRYWEDELKLPIERNEMGHRCYKEKDIETMRRIKQLKEQGLQLRAIRVVLQGRRAGAVRHDVSDEQARRQWSGNTGSG